MNEEKKKNYLVVVDDEADIVDLYKSILSIQYDVEGYSNPKAFLKALDQDVSKVPDLLISDYNMPEMNGLQMIQEAQRSGHYFPFILLSGFLDKDVVIQAVDVGVFRLLEKPTEYTLLLHTIDQLMIEHDVYKVRKEIRSLSSQLRELYTGIRLALLQHIPAETLNRIIRPATAKQDPSIKTTGIVKDESFEELLERLETRLEKLIASEKILDEMRVNKLRNPMKTS